jgi:hypothetical protein
VSKTSDGRDFASLTEKDVMALARPEARQYLAWQRAKIRAQDDRIKALDERSKAQDDRIKAQDEEEAQIAAAHAAQQTLKSLMTTYKANGRLNDAEKAQAREALKNPLVPESLRANLQKVFGL